MFLILAVATGLVWLSAVLWIETSTRAQVERVLDARLAEAARMVSSLIADHRIEVADAGGRPTVLPPPLTRAEGYSRQLSCQIWSLEGTLVGKSEGAPPDQLTQVATEGYSDSIVDGEPWRVYSVLNRELGLRVMVGDSLAVRDSLVRGVIEGLVLPAAVILPMLAALIWISVSRGLAPLERLAQTLRARSPADLSPLPARALAREIQPVQAALDTLFARVAQARDAERDFTTYAAHELKTPLAGLRTQAQVARMAPDAATRDAALRAIETSVDRTDRMVRQLLDLAEVDRTEITLAPTAPAELVAGTVTDLTPLARARDVRIVALDAGDGRPWITSAFLLQAALRNVLENALLASPRGGTVTVRWQGAGGPWEITVSDEGPGLSEALRDRATERFVRGAERGGHQGSGLGLSIVASALSRLGGALAFEPRQGGGQVVRLTGGRAAGPSGDAPRSGPDHSATQSA